MLSSDDIKTAQRLIIQYRKFSAQWRVMRWVILLMGICALGLAVFGFIQMEKLAVFNASAQLALNPDRAAENIGIVMDARLNLLRTELRMYSGIIITGSVGGVLFAMVLLGWNKSHLDSSLKASLLEAALENAEKSGSSDS